MARHRLLRKFVLEALDRLPTGRREQHQGAASNADGDHAIMCYEIRQSINPAAIEGLTSGRYAPPTGNGSAPQLGA
eukprot:116973-Prymnesium_polylepis.1